MLRRFLIALGLAVVAVGGCTVSTVLLDNSEWMHELSKMPVEKARYDYPVLVVVPADDGSFDAGIVSIIDLPLVEAQFPSYTLLAPEGNEAETNRRLGSLKLVPREGEEPRETGRGSVRIESQEAGRQQLMVQNELNANWENTSWYDATDTEIVPRYHRYYARDRSVFGLMTITAPINVVVWGVGLLIWKLWRRRRRDVAG